MVKNGKRAPKGVRNSCLGEPCRAATLGEGLPYIQVSQSRYLLFPQAILKRRRSKDEMGVPDASMGMDGYEQSTYNRAFCHMPRTSWLADGTKVHGYVVHQVRQEVEGRWSRRIVLERDLAGKSVGMMDNSMGG